MFSKGVWSPPMRTGPAWRTRALTLMMMMTTDDDDEIWESKESNPRPWTQKPGLLFFCQSSNDVTIEPLSIGDFSNINKFGGNLMYCLCQAAPCDAFDVVCPPCWGSSNDALTSAGLPFKHLGTPTSCFELCAPPIAISASRLVELFANSFTDLPISYLITQRNSEHSSLQSLSDSYASYDISERKL
ncbi:jg7579 [Pararge aegeria aegeria]|uniref:Jg7579 protein n=1 Tax=Pararge aegeria aegeria TaxID=348720 RepID=A0A8S4S6X1_9NEOP|nr:jg7579 [Pararge aegeria aegeria]